MVLRKLSDIESEYAGDNYHLIMEFLRKSKLDPEKFFDFVVLEYLQAVEKYLNDSELRERCTFEQVSFMYMKRAIYKHFREMKAKKRSPINGVDISFEEAETYIGAFNGFEDTEYAETVTEIIRSLTTEQQQIFLRKLEGYRLNEIAEIYSIENARVYRQFRKIKDVVADVMEIK